MRSISERAAWLSVTSLALTATLASAVNNPHTGGPGIRRPLPPIPAGTLPAPEVGYMTHQGRTGAGQGPCCLTDGPLSRVFGPSSPALAEGRPATNEKERGTHG